jgi:hypothetical protein
MMFLVANTPADAEVVRRYSVVIGVNQPAKEGQKPLRFADDDAARFFALLKQLPGEASLFSLFDADTQALYPELVAEAELPEKELILARLTQMFERMAADRKQGVAAELYFIYSGHGFVDDHGEGHLGMKGAPFSRTELYNEVLSRSPARINHVIVDACDAYFFVQSRGTDEEVERLLERRAQDYLDRQTLSRFPNTGAILSTASAAESHEWSEIKAGVFSHEVRSALIGAADADQDSRISYDEMEAFVLSANAGVKHAGAERAVFVRAPERHRAHAVIDLSAVASANRLHVPEGLRGRIALSDERGRRYADLHKAAGYSLALRLLPGIGYFVKVEGDEYRVPGDSSDVYLAQLEKRPEELASKGASISDAFSRGLFAVPFGPELVHGFELGAQSERASVVVAKERSRGLFYAGIAAGGVALLAGGVAGGAQLAGDDASDEYLVEMNLGRRAMLAEDVRAWDARTSFLAGTAISLALTSGVLLLIDVLESP